MRILPIAGLVMLTAAACGPRGAGEEPAATPPSAGTPGAEVDAAAAGGALVRDDFSDPASGWTVRDRGDYRNEYRDGRYLVRVDNARSAYIVNVAYRDGDLTDVRIEVDASRLSGAPSAGVGLECRAERGQQGRYYGEIDGDGEARIGAEGEEQEVLAETTRPALWQEGANRLRLDCAGDQLSLWLNGEKLLSARDDRYRSGRIGLRAGGGSGEVTEVAFDDLLVTAPSAAAPPGSP